MNKKFINLLLASVLSAGAVQVFTSCKDNEADLQKNIQFEYESLEARVKANEDKLAALPGQLEALKNELNGNITTAKNELTNNMNLMKTELENKITTLKNELNTAIGDAKTDLQNQINTLESALRGEIDANHQEMLDKFIQNDAKLAVMQAQIDQNITDITNLRTDLTLVQADLTAANAAIAVLQATVADQATRLATVETTLAQVQTNLGNLTTKVDNYITATDARLDALEAFMNEWKPVLPEIMRNAQEALAKANANAANIEAINDVINELKDADASNASLISGLQMKIDNILAQLENVATLDDLGEVATYLQNQARNYYQQAIGYTNLMIEQVLGQMNAMNKEIISVKDFQEALDTRLSTVEVTVGELKESLSKLEGTVGEIDETVGGLVTSVGELNTKINNLNEEVEGIQTQLNTITGRIDEIAGRISSIVIQGTDSPVFGSVRLPLGIQSNMLVAYMGEVAYGDAKVEFPLVAETAGTYDSGEHNILTQEDKDYFTRIGIDIPVEVVEGRYMNKASNGQGLLGKVYATINPSKVDVDNFTFNLVNSRGEQITNPLEFTPSDELLTFGYSRAASDNGFYMAEATVDPTDEAAINSVRFHFNDNLKNTVKEILKAPRASANRNTVIQLASAVYDQLNGFLPAIGVEAVWNDSEKGDMKVTSNYAIATAVAKPLSFTFLQGYAPGRHIPNLLPQLDKIKEKFNVVFDELTGDLKITLYDPDDPNSGFHINTPQGGWVTKPEIHINISLDGVHVDNPDPVIIAPIIDEETGREIYGGETITIDISSSIDDLLADLQEKLNGQLEAQLSGIGDSFDGINEQLDTVISNISGEVNKLLSSMQEEIDTTISEVVNNIKDKVNGALNNSTLNGMLGRLDGIINRLNNMMDNINYYLQPTLLYANNGNYGMVSANPAWPSVMVVGNDNAGIMLIPTTYTYETVVPVFEKYVAVTRAWNTATGQSAADVVLEANDNTGANTNMNKVLDGSTRKVALKLQKGFTYEIMYQALDFNGYVSGRKYYISVK